MPVVINEFEVVERSPLQRAADAAPAANEAEAVQQLEPLDLWPALRALDTHAVRAWAH